MYTLTVLPEQLAICQLPSDAPFPTWARSGSLLALVRTADELSIVCNDAYVPEGVRAERGWCSLKVAGPLGFSMVGVIAALSTAIAEAGVSIFSLSTFDTDYILLQRSSLDKAIVALQRAGCTIQY